MWASLLNKLEDSQSPDLPPHISPDNLNSVELQHMVIGGIRNKSTWDKDPKLTRMEELRIQDLSSEDASSLRRVDARLVPGGRYILVDNCGSLTLWDIATHRCLWIVPTRTGRDDCISFDFEVVDGGARLMVAVVFLTRGSRTT